MLEVSVAVPTNAGSLSIELKSGTSVVLIGANGSGKTRLGVFIDRSLSSGNEVHRIAAHRSLVLNPNVVPPNLELATRRLRFGTEQGTHSHKEGHRWQGRPAVTLLSDYDHLLAALYAENNNISVMYRQSMMEGSYKEARPPVAKIDLLKSIWGKVLPHRQLVTLDASIKTRVTGGTGADYEASEMSDGERVIFYLIGQALLAQQDTLLIIDEPELHINKAVMSRLWDEIESSRPDCAFLYITHDVEFAASRHAATKFALRGYSLDGGEKWDIEQIPDEANLPDDVVATIIGSRKPVLFVEGDGGSLDSSIYRRVYDNFTVVPVGSCDQVIHSATTFAARKELHHIGAAGIVDADGRMQQEVAYLGNIGVYVLPVSEVENLLLLPAVFLKLAKALKFDATQSQNRLDALIEIVLQRALNESDAICLRRTVRLVDSKVKSIGLQSKQIGTLDAEFRAAVAAIDPAAIFAGLKTDISNAITSKDYEAVLRYFDNKGLLSEAAKLLGYNKKSLEEFIGRALRSNESNELHAELLNALPKPVARP